MIDFIRGEIRYCGLEEVVVEVGGLGYRVYVLNIEDWKEGLEVFLHTYLLYREDGMELYGFKDRLEREVFVDLLSVGGVGGKLGMRIMRGIGVGELIILVREGNVRGLKKVKGLGGKVSEKLILELGNKFQKRYRYFGVEGLRVGYEGENCVLGKEVLRRLGYRDEEIEGCFEKFRVEGFNMEEMTTEEVVKQSLKYLEVV